MKGRMSANVWKWTGINVAALLAVLLLAYGAGARGGGLGLQDFGALPQAAGFRLLGAIFVVVAATVALVIQLSSRVLRPVEQLTEFSERLAAGDYTKPLQVQSEDEFSIVAERYAQVAQMAERTDAVETGHQHLEVTLTELSELLAEAGDGDLFKRAQVASDASAHIAESINRMLESLSRTVDKIHDSGADVANTARHGLSAAESAVATASRQQQSVFSLSSAIDKLNAGLRETLATAETAMLASQRAVDVAGESGQALTDAAENAARIRTAMKATADHIKTLAERSLQVYQVINIINETHLLAVSAAMEASRAAQSGNGLAVLDAELRKMGEHSRKSTQSVVTLLQNIHAEANEAAAIVEQANRMAEAGANGMDRAVQVFAEVSSSLEQASARSESAADEAQERFKDAQALSASLEGSQRLARQQVESCDKAVASIEKLVRSTVQLQEAVSRLRTTPTLKAEALAAGITSEANSSAAPSSTSLALGLS